MLGLIWILVSFKEKESLKYEAFCFSEIQSQRFTADKLSCYHWFEYCQKVKADVFDQIRVFH